MQNDYLSPLFFGDKGGRGVQLFMAGNLTAYNSTTHTNTLVVNNISYTNALVLSPATLTTGAVLVVMDNSGPMVLGNYAKAS